MSPESNGDFRPTKEYRRAARARFSREAAVLYRRGTRVRRLRVAVAAAALVVLGVALWWSATRDSHPVGGPTHVARSIERVESAREWGTDGTRVIAADGARWEWPDSRKVVLHSGRLFLDVEPTGTPFQVVHAKATVNVLGTRLVVAAEERGVRVDVGSGEASVSNEAGAVHVGPGEEGIAHEGEEPVKIEARRFSHLASFAAAAWEDDGAGETTPSPGFASAVARVPGPGGQVSHLEVVKYHLDVHIEDGMARTTIDQTFYNQSGSRVEGTFHFPLPPDASISRLAMYVDGKLMEGGMAERSRAVEVYEGIVRKMKDPAILEWMEGSTFRLRIFPFEPRSERRIILSYQQSLESLYEVERYRFPILEPADAWGTFSVHVLVKGGARDGWKIATPTYALRKVEASGTDVELGYEAQAARPAKDVIIEMERPQRPSLDVASHEADGTRMISITATPEISKDVYRGARRVLLVVDRSGAAAESERRAQTRMAKRFLRALDRKDRVNVLSYGTEPRLWREDFVPRTRKNVNAASEFLEDEPFVGAGDLAAALRAARDGFGAPREGDVLVYLGDGIDTLSGLEPERIALILPEEIQVLAIPVNRSFDSALLGALAARSGGRVVPVSPDERIGWRAFDLVSSLRTPAWRDVRWELLDGKGQPVPGMFHQDRLSLRHGESVRLVGRLEKEWPRSLRLNGKELPLPERRAGGGWIPRLWAKLRIDALERDSAAEHRDEIVSLGKDHYVMTPFTSLLVLENDAMYAEYKIDRGRRDHWALYPTPQTWRGKTRPPRTPVTFWRWGATSNNWFQSGVFDPGQSVDWSWDVNPILYYDYYNGFAPAVDPARDVLNHLFSDGFAPITTIVNGNVAAPRVLFPADFDGDGVLDLETSFDGRFALPQWAEIVDFTAPQLALDGIPPLTSALAWRGNFAPLPSWVAPRTRLFVETEVAAGETEAATEVLRGRLPSGVELSVDTDGRRVVVFASGERMVLEDDRAVHLAEGASAVLDPLFDTVLVGDPTASREWMRMPWFLLPAEALTAGARVASREEGERTVVTVDRGTLTLVELVFEGQRAVETRVVLRGGRILQRVVYDAWTDVAGHTLPTHGRFHGPTGKAHREVTYRYGPPQPGDHERLARLRDAVGQGIQGELLQLQSAVAHYRSGNRSALESLLRAWDKDGAASDALRKVARLSALRWKTEPVIPAPPLDPELVAVRRWLPADPVPLGVALERSVEVGDTATLATLAQTAKDPAECIAHLDRLRARAPVGLQEVLDLWIGELATRKGWRLKAYAALSRAALWEPLAENVALRDRLSELALGMNEVEAALEHAEIALEILQGSAPADTLSSRLEKIADTAVKNAEIWNERGQDILERWARVAPRDPKPFGRLAEFHAKAGRTALAVRCASQGVELSPTADEYTQLAAELEKLGDTHHAGACREIAARLKN